MSNTTNTALRQCLRKCRPSQSRSFTSSCIRRSALVTFPPSSSSELDTLFQTVRNTIFMPNHLKAMHRELIYRETLHHFITGGDPTIVPIKTVNALDESQKGEEHITLQPMSNTETMPSKDIYNSLTRLLSTKEDWEMLPAFLSEMKLSKRTLKQHYLSKLIRAAASKGHYGLMLNMFNQSVQSGMHLDTKETAMEVMLLCMHRATTGGWSEKELKKAAKHADAAIWMMKLPAHATVLSRNQSNEPEILGVALALSGARSARLDSFQDQDGKVLEYAKAMVTAWPKAKLNLSDMRDVDEINHFLIDWSPTWIGLKLAQKIIKDETVLRQLKDIHDETLSPLIMQAAEAMRGFSEAKPSQMWRGHVLYQELSKALE